MQNFSKIISVLIFPILFLPVRGQSNLEWEKYINIKIKEDKKKAAQISIYRNNKINWNNSSLEDLKSLPFKKDLQEKLINIKNQKNNFINWKEFQNNTDLSPQEIKVLQNFIKLNTEINYNLDYQNYNKFHHQNNSIQYSKNLQRVRIEFSNSGFLGGVTEWDQGEIDFWDYKNITFRLPNVLPNTKIYGGSYQLNWGEGLVFNKDLFQIKSFSSIYNANVQKPKFYNYLSSNESQYLFGLSSNIKLNNLQLLPFYSLNRIDSKIKNNTIVNISKSGKHISSGQKKRKNNSKRYHLGLGAAYKYKHGRTGLLIYNKSFSHQIQGTSSPTFSGLSLIQNIETNKIELSGEGAWVENGSYALTINSGFDIKGLNIGHGFRYYDPKFHDALNCPNKNYSGNIRNKKGYNLGLKTELPWEIDFKVFFDSFSSITPEKEGEFCTQKVKTRIQLEKDIGDFIQTNCQFQRKVQQGYKNPDQKKVKGKLVVSWENFDLITRFGYKNVQTNNEHETGVAQNIYVDSNSNILPLQIGISNFYTQSFKSRLYLYEPGLPNRFNLPALFGTGSRYFLVINHSINELFMLYFKASYLNRKKLQSDEWKNKLKFEFTFKTNI